MRIYSYVFAIGIAFVFLSTMVMASYDKDVRDDNWDRTYANVEFDNDDIYKLSTEVTGNLDQLLNLEKGYFLCVSPYNETVTKRSSEDGSIVWQRYSSDGLGTIPDNYLMPVVDSYGDIYVNSGGKIRKLDGNTGVDIWSTSNMNGVSQINNLWMDKGSSVICARSSTGDYALFNAISGKRISSSSLMADPLDLFIMEDGNILALQADEIALYDHHFSPQEDWDLHFQDGIYERVLVGGSYNEYLILNNFTGISIYQYSFEELTLLANYSYVNGTYGNMCYSVDSNLILMPIGNNVAWGNSGVMMLRWDYSDPSNLTKLWESAMFSNSWKADQYSIMDRYGTVVTYRYGSSQMNRIDKNNGTTIQTYTATVYELYCARSSSFESMPMIYDADENCIIYSVWVDYTNSKIFWAGFNSTTVASGGGYDPIYPDEISEEDWSWIFFTFAIISLAAAAAFLGNFVFNSSIFLLVLGVLISIGAWYSVYPVEAMLLSVLCLFGLFISVRGANYE